MSNQIMVSKIPNKKTAANNDEAEFEIWYLKFGIVVGSLIARNNSQGFAGKVEAWRWGMAMMSYLTSNLNQKSDKTFSLIFRNRAIFSVHESMVGLIFYQTMACCQ